MHVVIMAGGRGTRFWPQSRTKTPKQFLHIVGDDTMIRQTYRRVTSIVPADHIWVVTNEEYSGVVAEQLPDLPPENILAEPAIRSTAPCIGLAAMHISHRGGSDIMAVLPADHYIPDTDHFLDTLKKCEETAKREKSLVTIGIQPSAPETGYGYIHLGDKVKDDVHHVLGFREKPDRETALKFLSGGKHLWNSGMFVWPVDLILSELETHCPEIHAGLRALGDHIGMPDEATHLKRIYDGFPNISIDYAVMEKADRVFVIPGTFSWSDVGSWSAVDQFWPADENGNAFKGNVVEVDVRNAIVESRDRLTALIGVENIIVINTPDALLICRKDRDQDIKKIIEKLEAENLNDYL